MIGVSIDTFHKNPEHQRRILADPANLPIDVDIQIGPETLDLLVLPIFDDEGEYQGAMATWSVVTKEKQVLRA